MWEIFDRFRAKPWQGRPTIFSAVRAWGWLQPSTAALRVGAGRRRTLVRAAAEEPDEDVKRGLEELLPRK